jgi:hypothetical protein
MYLSVLSMRNAYLLSYDVTSERSIFSQNVLTKIGFTVHVVPCIPHENPLVSNKLSMISIYKKIVEKDNYAYIFEDDINIHEDITLDEIVEYEKISPLFFYLGLCENPSCLISSKKVAVINHHDVIQRTGNCRGLHAIGMSNQGARTFLKYIEYSHENYVDVLLDNFTLEHPANVVRYDLESYIVGHRGILFQDRKKFPSSIP